MGQLLHGTRKYCLPLGLIFAMGCMHNADSRRDVTKDGSPPVSLNGGGIKEGPPPIPNLYPTGTPGGTTNLPAGRQSVGAEELKPRITRLQHSDSPSSQGAIKKTSYAEGLPAPTSASSYLVRICAWVNGKPILMGDLLSESARELFDLQKVPEPARSVQRQEIMKKNLQHLIDQEVVYQEALRKLEGNIRFMDQLNKAAQQQYEKRYRAMLERSGLTETQLKQQLELQKTSLEALKRQTYRDFFVSTYMQSRITPLTDQIGHQDIRQYYEDHRNEFQTVDRVVWEDIFLATGTKRCPTMAEARQLGDHLVARLRAGEPFNKLTQYDDGDSRLRGGKGYGQRRGEIRPRELEKYLFQMQSGQIGPVVELSTGVHVFRVVERDFAGQIPFSEEVQDQIRQKLRNELTAREFRRIIRELSSRAVLEVNPDSLR